jgi:2,5-diketo-D-gluconate reductase B
MSTSLFPALGLGTFPLKGEAALAEVRTGLELGYRLVDTAQAYDNEAEVGQAVAESGLPRDEVFLTTKVWFDRLQRDQLLAALEGSLQRLRVAQVDLTLVHWPSPGGAVPMREYLGALAEARDRGLTRLIGVSNFNIALLREAIAILGPGAIATNQVELHPYLQNRKLAAFCGAHGIRITSYMTLARGKVLADPVIAGIAAQRGATPAQVVLAWAMQLGHAVIPSSTKRENLEGNLKARELRLNDDEMQRIAALERNGRMTDPAGRAPVWD